MIELNSNTAKITIADETVTSLFVWKDKEFLEQLPIPQGQDYAELSNLPQGQYVVVHLNDNIDRVLKEEFVVEL